MKKIFALTLSVLMILGIFCSCETRASAFEYTVNKDETVSITKYIGKDKTVVIPEKIEDKIVKYISENAFENSDIKSITFSPFVTEIGDSAFKNCKNLSKISGWDGVTKISNNAFKKCPKLEIVTVPSNVELIGISAFSECNSLKEIFIPKSVKYISASFTYNPSLEKVTLEEGIQELSGYVLFGECPKLKTITIPKSVNKISGLVFWEASSLESVKFLGNVPEFATDTPFSHRGKDLTIYYNRRASGWDDTTLSVHTLEAY